MLSFCAAVSLNPESITIPDHDEPTNKDEPHTHQVPQMTVYDSLSLSAVDFGLFVNSTCGLRINGTVIPCAEPELDPGGIDPDVLLSGVARHRDKFFSQRHFYERASAGTLPAFSFVYPPVQACDHPCHDMAKGERLLKDIYEAVRAGPKWEKTLLLLQDILLSLVREADSKSGGDE